MLHLPSYPMPPFLSCIKQNNLSCSCCTLLSARCHTLFCFIITNPACYHILQFGSCSLPHSPYRTFFMYIQKPIPPIMLQHPRCLIPAFWNMPYPLSTLSDQKFSRTENTLPLSWSETFLAFCHILHRPVTTPFLEPVAKFLLELLPLLSPDTHRHSNLLLPPSFLSYVTLSIPLSTLPRRCSIFSYKTPSGESIKFSVTFKINEYMACIKREIGMDSTKPRHQSTTNFQTCAVRLNKVFNNYQYPAPDVI